MKVVFFILPMILLVVFIVALNIKVKVLFLASLKTKSAYYTINHRIFKVMQGKVLVLSDGSVSVITKKNKMLEKRVPKLYSKILAMSLLQELKPTRIDIYLNSGKVSNAYITALVSGAGDVFGGVIKSILDNHGTKIKFNHITDITDDEFSLAVNLNVKISLLKLVFVFINSKKQFKEEKEKQYAV